MRRVFVLLVTLAMTATAAPALAAPGDNPAALQRVVVQLRPDGPAPGSLAAETVARFGGTTGGVFGFALKGFVAELPPAAVEALSRNPNVLTITPDQVVVSIAAQETPTGYDRTEADLLPRGSIPISGTNCPAGETCTDVDIAVIDTGIDPHPDLNVVQRTDCNLLGFCSDGAGFDDHGHGSHVAGIAAAFDNDFGVVGIAPGARLWSVKVLDASGTGFLSAILAGIDWVTARADEIDVVNMSLAGEFTNEMFDTAIANSVAAGVTYVVAAGNGGVDANGTSPADHPDVITVSAVADADGAAGGLSGFRCRKDQTDDTLATFSNYGAAVDIAAPGVCILSTWRDGEYGTISGTSMASPQVAGAAALYLAYRGSDLNDDGQRNAQDVALVKSALVSGGLPQNSACGFAGDSDGLAEPLLFVNGPAFDGTGVCEQEPVDSSPPLPPGSLTAAADGFAVDLEWEPADDPESGIMEYRIYRDTVPSTGETLIGDAAYDATTYVDRATLPATAYSYEVAAVNLQFGEARSNAAQATTAADDADNAGWWRLDDATGTVAADESAWRRPGMLVNGPTWSTGKLGGALNLDGNDDRVDFDHTVLDGFGDITASMWLRTTKTGEQALISGANTGNPNEYLLFLAGPTTLRLYTGSSNTTGVSWTLPYSLADGVWHHLAVIRNNSQGRTDAYLDGNWVGAWGVGMDPVDIDPGGLLFGQDQDSVGGGFQASQAFTGGLDDLRLYTRVLTAAEIAELAQADTTPPGAPSTLSAVTDLVRVDVEWAAAADPESGISAYEIWRGTGGDKTLLAEVPGTVTSYPDVRTVPDTVYFYEVRAVNGFGVTGPFSPEAEALPTSAGSGDATLMGWWELDDGFGTTAADSSDYRLDALLVNGPSWDPGGEFEGALAFDGSDDRVDLDAQILDGANDVTVALWVKTTKTGVQALVSAANEGNDAEYEVVMLSNPDLRLRFYTGETNETFVMWPVPGLADGSWHHLAVTRDAAADQATLYIDGVSQGDRSAVFEELTVPWGGLLLGQEQDSVGGGFDPTQSFEGSLDDVRLYRRVLSEAEIANLIEPPVPDTTPPVITLLGDDPQTIEGGDPYVELGATAIDDVDGDVTSSIVVDASAVDTSTPGTYAVTYDVVDSSGNAATQVTRTVIVVDTTAPVITLLGDPVVTVEVGSVYTDAGATAADIVDGDLTSSIVTVNPVDTSTAATYTVTFDVTDTAGNAAVQVTRTVEVVAGPVVVDVYPISETTVLGAVANGDLSATTASDDVYEVLAEHHQGGRPSNRVSALDHRWTFEIGNPDQVVLNVEAHRDLNSESDDFLIEYSTDGTTFLPLLVIDSVDDTAQQAALPDGTSGTVIVRVVDTDRTPGNAASDVVLIDELFLRTTTGNSGLPRVSVAATDSSAAEAGISPGEFTLTRSDSVGALTVEVSLTGTAAAGDYQPVATSVEFTAGSPTATVVITPVDDTETEGPETVVLTVVAGSGYEVGFPDAAEVTIDDDDVITVDDLAESEATVHGTSSGGFTDTHASDDTYQAITEESHVGGKRSRLEHIWTFDVTGGSTVVFGVEAYRSNSSDAFTFAYSTDGANWIGMLTVSKISDDDAAETFALPSSLSGVVYIRVQDTDRTKSDPVLATVWVDHMFIRSG
jgi:hypothetical protein